MIHIQTRDRDPETERRERESFIILQHLFSLRWVRRSASVQRLALDLGLTVCDAEEIVDHLLNLGYLERTAEVHTVRLTPSGAEYIERLAWRRRSVRA